MSSPNRQAAYWRQYDTVEHLRDNLMSRLARHAQMAATEQYPQAMIEELQALETTLSALLHDYADEDRLYPRG